MKQIKPTTDKLLIKVSVSAEKVGSIYIPDQIKEEKTEGVVISVGGMVNEIKPTDTVIFGKYAGDEIIVDDTKYRILREVEVLAIIQYEKQTTT